MLKTIRLLSPEDVIKNWTVFSEGLKIIRAYEGESFTEDEYCKMVVNLTARPESAWVGLVFQSGWPVSYGIAIDSTLPFSSQKTYTVCSFYHVPGQHDATFTLMTAFEQWAVENGVNSYVVTTRRQSGPALHCFSSGRYGFKKSYRAFEKKLS